MENFPQLVPLIILIPSVGAFINFFWGGRAGEKFAAIVATVASSLAFLIAVLLYLYLANNNYEAAVVNPAFFSDWLRIDSIGLNIPWQMRVDTLSVTMMLVVTGVGSLIHMYAVGYMHGDERFSRFMAYLNMFLAFMLILVTGNNFLMMFVGWEGVGLCSYLLIGFWWDKPNGVGLKNSNAARKAFVVNRVGDFGLLLGIFLTFWTFGTLDYYKPGETVNAHAGEREVAVEAEPGDEGVSVVVAEGDEPAAVETALEEAAAEGDAALVATADEHGEVETRAVIVSSDEWPLEQLGVFGQADRLMTEQEESGEERMVQFGPITLPLGTVIGLITFFFLIGAAGKSAQIPLFVWLPDAMAGPTPVSALIHAATMVTAGVYMMTRSNVLYSYAEVTSFVVTVIGASTALVAGFIAMGQWDIKRVLAYSTISQLGFMVAAVGVGAFGAAMFHLVTNAFFKALLFLGSGSVIHGVEHGHHETAHGHGHGHDEHADAHHEEHHDHEEKPFDPQDMRNMGGLRRRMPITYWTYVFGTLALAGIFPFAGFWSKDEILADSWLAGLFENNLGGYIALGLLLMAAGFTAFYMWRQVEMVFHGEPRTEAADHAHESSPLMTIPLLVLGFFSLFVGFINTPIGVLGLSNIFGAHGLATWLEASVANLHIAEFQPLIAIGALLIGLGAIFLARRIYGFNHALTKKGRDPLEARPETAQAFKIANARMYWDEAYDTIFLRPFQRLGQWLADKLDWAFWHDYVHDTIIWRGFVAIGDLLANPFDLGLIDGIVNGIGRLAQWIAGRGTRVQTGYVRTYAISVLLGVVIVILLLLLPTLPFFANAG